MGYMENIVRTDTHKGSCRKTGSYIVRDKGERKLKTKSECMRVGGVTLSLLPNLASESATAGGGVVVVGETDISGLRLLEAHFGLDWAAEGLDLISLDIAPHHLHLSMHIHSPQLHPSLYTERFTTKLLTLSPHIRYLKHAVPTQTPSQPHYPPVKTPSHAHSFPTNTPLSIREQLAPTSLLPLQRHSPSIHPTSISEGLL